MIEGENGQVKAAPGIGDDKQNGANALLKSGITFVSHAVFKGEDRNGQESAR